jgi:hypothetical protein
MMSVFCLRSDTLLRARAGAALRAPALAITLAWLAAMHGAARAEPPHPLSNSGYLLRTWGPEDGLPENSATAIVQTQDGYLWFGTFNGLVRFNGARFKVFNPANTPQLPSAVIVSLHADKRDRLWVSTDAGVVVKDGTQWRALGASEGWAGNFARTITERVNGDLLFTTFDGHVLAVENDRLTELPPPPGERGQGYLGTVDESGRWWLAQNRFVGYWNGQQWVSVLDPSPSAGRSSVACVTARGGGVWILLSKGLWRFRGGRCALCGTGLAPDERPPLIRPPKIEQLTYHHSAATPNAEENGLPSASDNVEVRLTAPFEKPLRLPAGARGLELEFAALTFSAPEKVRFQYRFDDTRPVWKDAGQTRLIRLHLLPPGEYVFHVRAANNDGIWNEGLMPAGFPRWGNWLPASPMNSASHWAPFCEMPKQPKCSWKNSLPTCRKFAPF